MPAATAGGGDRHPVGVRLVTDDGLPRVQRHRGRLQQGLQQQPVQVGAVDGRIGRAITLPHRFTQGQTAQHPAIGGRAHAQLGGKRRHRLQRLLQPPVVQHAHGVGAELDTRPDLGKLWRPFEHVDRHLGPRARACQGRAQAGHTPPDNDDPLLHAPPRTQRSVGQAERAMRHAPSTAPVPNRRASRCATLSRWV